MEASDSAKVYQPEPGDKGHCRHTFIEHGLNHTVLEDGPRTSQALRPHSFPEGIKHEHSVQVGKVLLLSSLHCRGCGARGSDRRLRYVTTNNGIAGTCQVAEHAYWASLRRSESRRPLVRCLVEDGELEERSRPGPPLILRDVLIVLLGIVRLEPDEDALSRSTRVGREDELGSVICIGKWEDFVYLRRSRREPWLDMVTKRTGVPELQVCHS